MCGSGRSETCSASAPPNAEYVIARMVGPTAGRRRGFRDPRHSHPLGARPFARADYIRKFRTLAEPVLAEAEIERFLALVQRLPELSAAEVRELNIVAAPGTIDLAAAPKGLF